MTRFFVDPQAVDIPAGLIALTAEDTEHIRSLRLRPNEHFIVCDGHGIDYICKLGQRNNNTIAEITGHNKSHGEPTVKCSIYIAFQKGERLEYAVQKSVELGAYEIILFESDRCIAIARDIPKKISRLSRIAYETAKLSDRGIIPSVSYGGKYLDVIETTAIRSSLKLFFYESENNLHIRDVLEQYFSAEPKAESNDQITVSAITGPEGGFERHEVESAATAGFKVVSLGPRILRSETAPVAALAAIMYQSGNF